MLGMTSKGHRILVVIIIVIFIIAVSFRYPEYSPSTLTPLTKEPTVPAVYVADPKLDNLYMTKDMGVPPAFAKTIKEVIPALAYEIDTASMWELRETFTLKEQTVLLKWEPTFGCSLPVRIGEIGDGGKWVCNAYQLLYYKRMRKEKVLIYSLGSASDYSFEIGINSFFQDPEIHTFDLGKPHASVAMPPFVNFHQYKIVGVGQDSKSVLRKREEYLKYNGVDENTQARSIGSIMKELGHTQIDILKVDIEGAEYEVLKTYVIGGCNLNTNILLLETHWDSAQHYTDLFRGLTDNCGMEIYYKEPNIKHSLGDVIEWCWVKVDWSQRPKELGVI